MAEFSFPWDGVSLGDANRAPYSAVEFAEQLNVLTTVHAVSPFQSGYMPIMSAGYGSLLVSGVATPVSVAAGYAVVAGWVYQNTAANTLAIPTPGANPRLDRIVIRIDYAAQTARLARLAGAEAATPSPPALTQVVGTTYEVALAQVYITTGGVITVLDERVGFQGLGPGVFFRDIRDRVLEEFFDNFNNSNTASGSIGNTQWNGAVVSGGVAAANNGVPSSINISSSTTANSSYTLHHGAISYPTELAQAPLLFEARLTPLNAAADAVTVAIMRLISAAGTQNIYFGVDGSISTTKLVLTAVNGGTTSFVTGTNIDTSGAYHTLGIWVPSSAGPVVALYDGVAIGQVGANLPTLTTDMRAEFVVGNGATAAARAMNIDWARLVRGTA